MEKFSKKLALVALMGFLGMPVLAYGVTLHHAPVNPLDDRYLGIEADFQGYQAGHLHNSLGALAEENAKTGELFGKLERIKRNEENATLFTATTTFALIAANLYYHKQWSHKIIGGLTVALTAWCSVKTRITLMLTSTALLMGYDQIAKN